MTPAWSYICSKNAPCSARDWLSRAHLSGELSQETIDDCWEQACRLGARHVASALDESGHHPSSSSRMQSLFLGQLDERLAKSEGDRSNACFPSLLAVQHQVTDEAALALSKAKAGTGLARALLSGAWSPSPEVFLECLRAHRNHDPAACLAGAMLKRNPRFPLDHPEVAHAVMEELVRLCIEGGMDADDPACLSPIGVS